MQFHAVFCHADLLVKNIKKSYAFHAYYPGRSQATEVRLRFSKLSGENLPHFSKVLCLRRAACSLALLGRHFADHSACNVIGIGQNQMKVAVAVLPCLLLPPEQYGFNGIDLFLRVGTLVAQHLRGAHGHQLRNGSVPRLEIDALGVVVKDCLDVPAFRAAVDTARELWRWRLAEVTQQQERRYGENYDEDGWRLCTTGWHRG